MHRKKLILPVVLVMGLLLGVAPEVTALEKWGPFRGRVVDVETGEPLKDVAVLVVWWKDQPNPVHWTRGFYEAKEAVTDADGRFEVPRLTPPFFTFLIRPGQVIFFAPGYVEQGRVVTPPDGQPFVDPTVVQMRRLKTRAELLQKSRGQPGGIPHEKMVEFLKAIKVERKMLGLD